MFFIFLIILNVNNVLSISLGVSPNILKFNLSNESTIQEREVVLFNPNNYSLKFNINSCNESIFDYLKSGVIGNNSYKVLLIRHNGSFVNISKCFLEISFLSENYKTALSVDIEFLKSVKLLENNSLDDKSRIIGNFLLEDDIDKNLLKSNNWNAVSMVIATIVFLILIVAILLYR